jgi:uncharacterized membrane protein
MHQTVLGAFDDAQTAAEAVDALQRIPDVRTDQISLVMTDATKRVKVDAEGPSRLIEGTALGSGLGLLLGGLAALTLAATAGGAVLAVGPLLAALTGMGIGAAGGGLAGGLVAIGVPEQDAIEIRQWVEQGFSLDDRRGTGGKCAADSRVASARSRSGLCRTDRRRPGAGVGSPSATERRGGVVGQTTEGGWRRANSLRAMATARTTSASWPSGR